MKQLLLLCFHLILYNGAAAQKKVVSKKYEPVVLDIKDYEAAQKIKLPFSAIQVIDVRFDRTNIGCVNYKRQKTTAVFPDSLHSYLPSLLNKIIELDKNREDTLVVLLKQFRITDHLINGINLQYEPELLLKLSASFFKRNNGQLMKLFSLNDLLSKKWPTYKRPNKDFIADCRIDAFMALLQNIFENKNWQTAGAGFTLASVEEGISKRFNFPLLTDTFLRAGVYKNFEDFKLNQPSVTNVKMGMRHDKLTEVKDATGKELEPGKFWGACDGKKRYVVFRGEFRELIATDKSFRFLAYSQTSDLSGQPGFGDYAPQTGIIPALLIKALDNTVNWEYFYLNMDEQAIHLEEVFGRSHLANLQKELLK